MRWFFLRFSIGRTDLRVSSGIFHGFKLIFRLKRCILNGYFFIHHPKFGRTVGGAEQVRFPRSPVRAPGKARPMKAVISVIGKDTVGIIAKVSAECARCGVNILDISQTVLQDYFTMIMITDIDGITVPFPDFVDAMTRIGSANNLKILTMHEDIFNTMHKI